MYYVNKIVGWVLSPFGWLFLGIALGAILSGVKMWRWIMVGRLIIVLTLGVFWFLGTGIVTRVIGVPLEGEEARLEKDVEVENGIDAIVLLGGGMGVHEKCKRAEMFSGADRVWHAAKLWKSLAGDMNGNGRELKITLSGGGVRESTVPLLVDLGVPKEAMIFFESPRNTEEEAIEIKERLTHHCRPSPSASARPKVLLVTSAWHMPRAKMLFERVGLDVIAAPCDYEMHYVAERPMEIGDFFPNADSLNRNSYAIKEWVARVCYAIKNETFDYSSKLER